MTSFISMHKMMLLCSSMLLFMAASVVADAAEDSATSFNYDNLFQWVKDHPNAYVSDQQAYRKIDENDPSSLYGMFATQDIPKDTVLLQIPWDLVLHRGPSYMLGDSPDLASINCGSVRALWHHWEAYFHDKQTSNKFGPYLEYLKFSTDPSSCTDLPHYPSAWSDHGKQLLQDWYTQIQLPQKDLVTWVEHDWDYFCNKPNVTLPRQEERQIVAAVVSQAEANNMVPLFNLYNHRNAYYGGKHFPWMNVDADSDSDVYFQAIATRTVAAGEELYTSYNQCANCKDRMTSYGTLELFRDYGIVEEYPQRWIFEEEDISFDIDFVQDDDDPDEEGEFIIYWFDDLYPDDDDINILRIKLMALERFGTIEWQYIEMLPESEVDTFWKLHEMATVAVTEAIKFLERPDEGQHFNEDESEARYCLGGLVTLVDSPNHDGADRASDLDYCVMLDSYEQLVNPKVAVIDNDDQACDNFEELMFLDAQVTEIRQTHYQKMTFDRTHERDDVCMDLDGTLQICDSYRPQYHEYAVHYAAQYLETIERVLFIGGGDSMLLHEVLKYPSLKQVMGLELDQQVTRKSFKYFETQPHFDDPRVEWWFGDATKSLLLLPTEYYTEGAFDLVLVDLSETVTALTVTEKLDVLGALALLVKPKGILVKNEYYFNQVSNFFDYTQQINYRSPILCRQAMAMGSNGIDLFRAPTTNHGVETVLMKPFENEADKFEYVEDYGQNHYDLRRQGLCKVAGSDGEQDDGQDLQPDVRLAMHIVADAENATGDLSKVKSLIEQAGNDLGLTYVATLSLDPTVIVFEEAYVSAMVWPGNNYCALDIHMWASYDRAEQVRDAMISAVGSDPSKTQSYRVIVGGMYDHPKFEEEHNQLGPPKQLPPRFCENLGESTAAEAEEDNNDDSKKSISSVLLGELIPTARGGTHNLAAVFCGLETDKESCEALNVLSALEGVSEIVPIWTCPDLVDVTALNASTATAEVLAGISGMYECESSVRSQLEAAVTKFGKFTAIVLDATAPHSMTKIVFNTLRSRLNRKTLLEESIILLSVQNSVDEVWKPTFIEASRMQFKWNPIFAATMIVQDGSTRFEKGVSMLVTGDPEFLIKLTEAESNINKALVQLKDGDNVKAQVIRVRAGLEPFIENLDVPRFNHSHYDFEPAQKQFEAQMPMGRQTIFQMEGTASRPISKAKLRKGLERTGTDMGYNQTHSAIQDDGTIGNGALVVVSFGSVGNAILVWGGRLHADLILFSADDDEELATNFLDGFMKRVPGMGLSLTLRDDQPRGLGRVINFKADMESDDSNADNEDETVRVDS